MSQPASDPAPTISDDAVLKATGKPWSEWFALLDAAGAQGLEHAAIARLLHDTHGCASWWSQTITVAYEQARGLREKHQKPGGFEISRSRTIVASADAALDAWQAPDRRERWLGPVSRNLVIRRSTAPHTLRITWPDHSQVEVRIAARDPSRCQVVVQQSKLPDATMAAQSKTYWTAALERLRAFLEPTVS